MEDQTDETTGGISRRGLLKGGAIVGAAAVWTVPLVQAISMTPAHAESPSGGGGGGGSTSVPTQPAQPTPPVQPTQPSGGTQPTTVTTPTAQAAPTNDLAFTGTDVSVPTTLGVAATAIALGVGALAAGAAIKRQQQLEAEA